MFKEKLQNNRETLTVLDSYKSPYQKIDLCRLQPSNSSALLLDGKIQYIEGLEKEYHDWLVGYPLSSLPFAKNVAIIGGGDGLAIRNAMMVNPGINIKLLELDPMMIQLAKRHPEMLKLNEGFINSSNVDIRIGDAGKTIHSLENGMYDLIAMDVSDYSPETKHLYSGRFCHIIKDKLKNGGMISAFSGGKTGIMKKNLLRTFGNCKRKYVSAFNLGSTGHMCILYAKKGDEHGSI